MVLWRSWRPYASTWNAAPVPSDDNGTKTGPCYANVIGKIWEWSCRMVLDHQFGRTWEKPTFRQTQLFRNHAFDQVIGRMRPVMCTWVSPHFPCAHPHVTTVKPEFWLGSKRLSPQLPAWIFRHRSWSHSRYWVASAIRGSAARIPDTVISFKETAIFGTVNHHLQSISQKIGSFWKRFLGYHGIPWDTCPEGSFAGFGQMLRSSGTM